MLYIMLCSELDATASARCELEPFTRVAALSNCLEGKVIFLRDHRALCHLVHVVFITLVYLSFVGGMRVRANCREFNYISTIMIPGTKCDLKKTAKMLTENKHTNTHRKYHAKSFDLICTMCCKAQQRLQENTGITLLHTIGQNTLERRRKNKMPV